MPAELSAIVEVFARVIREPEAPGRLLQERASFLAETLDDEADVEALGEHGARRLLAYRKLVRAGIASGVRAGLSATATRLGGVFSMWVERWLDEDLPRSSYVRDLAGEFLTWVAPRWLADSSLPPWIVDFAQHECALFEVAAAPSTEASKTPLALDQGVLFDGPTRLARYAYAVHLAHEDEDPNALPEARVTELLLYRDAEHDARWLVLTPLAAAILERLLRGSPLGASIQDACSKLGFVLEDSILRGTSEMLADLAARGVLLGAL